MTLQLCLCGAMPGYLHATDCPRPLYRASDEQERQWERDRAEIRHARRVREIAERADADAKRETKVFAQSRKTGGRPPKGKASRRESRRDP